MKLSRGAIYPLVKGIKELRGKLSVFFYSSYFFFPLSLLSCSYIRTSLIIGAYSKGILFQKSTLFSSFSFIFSICISFFSAFSTWRASSFSSLF